ncbi:MAG TPA: rhomboid family intramembrane serine protease [Candidatus Acidoferrales bacterium]|jgi:rhomboid protease GluP|nr:rhomboid family intramembrane serine protease [Candidatus Acidoferrales bacterium]
MSTSESESNPLSVTPAQTSQASAGITMTIIALNVAMFILMCIMGVSILDPMADSVLKWGANYGPLTLRGQWWRMFASLFIHFGIIHLLFNMVVLANIGPFIETLAGGPAYLILYVVAGLGGGAASLAWHPWTVSAGASGAIFGLYGALLAFLLRHRDTISPEVLKPLLKGAVIFVGYNVLYGAFQPDVDLTAHMGGLFTGFLLGLFLVQPVSQETSAGRGGRCFVASVLGLALLATSLITIPRPDDLMAEIKSMSVVEDKSLALFNSSLGKWKSDQLTDQQFLNIVEQEVLPPWRTERNSLARLNRLSKEQTQLASSLVQYMGAREDSWSLLVDGVRTGNMEKIKRSGEKNREADKLVDKLGAGGKK